VIAVVVTIIATAVLCGPRVDDHQIHRNYEMAYDRLSWQEISGSCAGQMLKGCGCILMVILLCSTCMSGCLSLLN